MGSTNLGKAVYCNPMDDVEYCVREMLKQKKTPEVETFEIGHTWAMTQLMKKYEFADPVLFSVVLGHEGGSARHPAGIGSHDPDDPRRHDLGHHTGKPKGFFPFGRSSRNGGQDGEDRL